MISTAIATAETLMHQGSAHEALDVLAGAKDPSAPPTELYELGISLLRASNGHLGWDLYDLHPSRKQDQIHGLARWNGQDCEHLIVMAEQGFGDAIQFMRFVPHARERARRITVIIHDELNELIRSSPCLDGCEIVSKTQARQRRWAPGTPWERLLSLPARLQRARPEPIGAYLKTPPVRRSDAGLTVGVAWRSTARRGFPGRSFPARLLQHLGDVRMVALHRDVDIASVKHSARTAGIRDFAETAAVVMQCDFVVTADTVTAHIAPALGIATLICLRHQPDWRWGTPASPTAWYQHATPLFQDETCSWPPVLRAAGKHIRDAVAIGQS